MKDITLFSGKFFFILYRRMRYRFARAKARYYDKKLGIEAEGSPCPESGGHLFNGRYVYQPTFYGRLEKMVKYLGLKETDVFVDFGCGKGRVVFFVALQKLKKVVGVDVDGGLIEIARKNLRNLRVRHSPVEFFYGDAVDYDVREGTVFFMYNPFGEETLAKVVNNIKESLSSNPRKIRIVYYVPQFFSLLDKQDWLAREGEIENKECIVWGSR